LKTCSRSSFFELAIGWGPSEALRGRLKNRYLYYIYFYLIYLLFLFYYFIYVINFTIFYIILIVNYIYSGVHKYILKHILCTPLYIIF
jgi:hypothetical protein